MFRLNAPKVIYENLDGEVVAINLDTGNYYSVLASGAEVWELLVAGHSVAEIVEMLSARYPADRADIESGVSAFVERLQEEELFVPNGDSSTPKSPATNHLPEADPDAKFAAPTFEKHTDMQDILLVDPIHEVDEAGWPMEPES